MTKERLWTLGNRVPSEFVHDLEMARRKAEEHRKATPEAWQDYVALRKLVEPAVSQLLVLENERADFTRRLTIPPAPEGMATEDADALMEDAVGGTLAHIAHEATMKGWPRGAIYRAMIAFAHYMLAIEENLHRQPGAGEPEIVPPFGTRLRKRHTESR